MILQLDQTIQIMNQIDHCLNEKMKIKIGLINDELGEKNQDKICWTKSKNLQLLNE